MEEKVVFVLMEEVSESLLRLAPLFIADGLICSRIDANSSNFILFFAMDVCETDEAEESEYLGVVSSLSSLCSSSMRMLRKDCAYIFCCMRCKRDSLNSSSSSSNSSD